MTMEEELSISLDGKNLANLRVVDLKQELEKRGLSKSGSKKDLIKRLKQQLEFEKLCEERKSTGDCELKKELDAATEQNEFVQRYLAQQQKIFAEQKEVKRLVELEESQKKSDTEESVISPKIKENPSSEDDDSELGVDSSSGSSSGGSAPEALPKETIPKKENDGKEDVSGTKQPQGNVIVEKHIIKIERDKVKVIISNKNQNICDDLKQEEDKNESKGTTDKASPGKECSQMSIKNETDSLSDIKSKETIDKEDKINVSNLVAVDNKNVSVDHKHDKSSVICFKEEKSVTVLKPGESFSNIDNSHKDVDLKKEDKEKTKTDKHVSITEDANKIMLTEDTKTCALIVENVDKSALKSESLGKNDGKTEEPNSSALKIEDENKRALKLKDTGKSTSSKIQNVKDIIQAADGSIEKDKLKSKDTNNSSLKTEDTYKSDSLNLKNKEETSLKTIKGEVTCLKIKETDESASIKTEETTECSLKKEDTCKTTLKAKNTGISTLKNEETTASVDLENKDLDKSVSLKLEDSNKSVTLIRKDIGKGSSLNIEISNISTSVKLDLDQQANQIVPDPQSNIKECGQSKSDLLNTSINKKYEDVSIPLVKTQDKADKPFAVERTAITKTSTAKIDQALYYAKKSKPEDLKNIYKKSPIATEKLDLSTSSVQKLETVPGSNIESPRFSTEPYKTNFADISLENKPVSMDSAVPYSLSEIQLPDSPSNIKKPVMKTTSKKGSMLPHSANDSDKDSNSDGDIPRNGLKSSSKSHSKAMLDNTSSKRKITVKEPKVVEHQNTSKTSKASDKLEESVSLSKSRLSPKEQISDSKEKSEKKVELKTYKSGNKSSESSSSHSSSEESSDSNDGRNRKKPRCKIAVKHSKARKNKSRSSSSDSQSSQSPERISKKQSKVESKTEEKKSNTSASRVLKTHKTESSNMRSSRSRRRTPSSSSQSRETSPTESPKKDADEAAKHYSKSKSSRKASKSKSRSPSSNQYSDSRNQRSKKSSKEKTDKEDTSIKKSHSRDSSDQTTSKSKSRSPFSNRSSSSRDKSPTKLSKESDKELALDTSKTARKGCASSPNQRISKSRSRSPSSSRSKGQSSDKYSKGLKKSDVTDGSIKDKRNETDSNESPAKLSKESIKGEIRIRKDHIASSDKNSSKSRSRSPSSSKSRERSPDKTVEPVKKSVGRETSRTQVHSTESYDKTSKSSSRSPSSDRSSQSRERSPVKPKEDRQSLTSSVSRSGRKRQSESSSDRKTSKSRSRSSSRSPHSRKSKVLSTKLSKPDIPGASSKRIEESNEKASSPVDQKTDPPRKKLKINRNNVVIPSLETSAKLSSDEHKKMSPLSSSEKISKVSHDSPKEEKEQSESTSSLQLDTVEREMGEIIENSPEVKYEPRKINFPGRKLSRKSSEDPLSSEPKSKKSKWGKFASSQKSSQAINISTDSLKNWFPEFKIVAEPVINDTLTEESPPIKEDKKLSFPPKIEEEPIQQSTSKASHQNNEEPILETTESSGPVSKIVFVQNLVRPFTLLQLKDLLRQQGNFIEEDFWIDKIKSKCFVTYETEEVAIKARNALNGVRWPSSNPKILSVEFSTEEEFEHHRSGKEAQKQVPERLPEVQETSEEKTPQPASDHRRKDRDSDKRKERERYRPQAPVREWDKDKVIQDSPDREKREKSIEGYRGSDRKDKKDTKKRPNEDTPAKLLDDLFQKTKSTPCIYWLPLTDALVLEREESRRLRRLEREKRNQQREKEESEQRNKRSRTDHKSREMENRRSSTRSRSPTSRRR